MLGFKYKNDEHIFNEKIVNDVPFLSYPLFENTGIVNHGFSTRLGGVSKGCWTSMNISITRGDDLEDVEINKERIAGAIGVHKEDFTYTHQTHTTNVARVMPEDQRQTFYGDRRTGYKCAGDLPCNILRRLCTAFLCRSGEESDWTQPFRMAWYSRQDGKSNSREACERIRQ